MLQKIFIKLKEFLNQNISSRLNTLQNEMNDFSKISYIVDNLTHQVKFKIQIIRTEYLRLCPNSLIQLFIMVLHISVSVLILSELKNNELNKLM